VLAAVAPAAVASDAAVQVVAAAGAKAAAAAPDARPPTISTTTFRSDVRVEAADTSLSRASSASVDVASGDAALRAALGEHVLHPADSNRFASAAPFPHVVIEDFFAAPFAKRLLAAFPPFERGNAVGDGGLRGGKSTYEPIARLGGAYAELDTLIQSPAWLALLERITGIPALLYDPYYLGAERTRTVTARVSIRMSTSTITRVSAGTAG
jgi:hypothetical protein